ncbi:MAG: LamG domain-containing protein [Tepidisphaeraceae bacterium]
MFATRHSIRSLICLLALAVGSAVANAGLIHRYSFKDPTVKDSVGNIDATLKGSAKITDGKLVLDNDGKTSDDAKLSYLEFNSSILPKSGSVSLVVWLTEKENPQYVRIIDFGDSSSGSGQAFIYLTSRHDSDQTKAAITASDTGSKTDIDGKRLDDGKPHMAAIVIDGTAKKLHLFIDGQEAAEAVDLGDNTLDKVNPVHCWLGRSGFDADPGLSASISEFRVYDNALTADEVAGIYKAGADAIPATQPASAK